MASWYVSASTGSDSNAGTSFALAWATVEKALTSGSGPAAGDRTWVAPGVYRERFSVGVSGSSGSPIEIFADVDGSHTTGVPGECQITAYDTNDTTAPGATTATINLNGKSYLTFDGFTIIGGTSTTASAIQATVSHSHDITLNRLTLISLSIGTPLIVYTEAVDAAANWVIDRCSAFAAASAPTITIATASPSGATDVDLNFLITNCFLFGSNKNVTVAGPASLTSTGKPGGVRVRSSTVWGAANGINLTTANMSTTIPCDCYDSIVHGTAAALVAGVSGSLVENSNRIFSASPRTNVIAGANSVTGFAHAPLFHVGQEIAVGRVVRAFMTPAAGSPLLNFGNLGASPSPPTFDFLGRPRPAGLGPGGAIGYLELHDTATPGGSANADGATGNCWQIGPGPSDHVFNIPVKSGKITTVSVKQKTATYNGTDYPQIQLLANPEVGVTAQTVADTAANTTYTTLTLASFTPTANGVVQVMLQNRTGDTVGLTYWDTATITEV